MNQHDSIQASGPASPAGWTAVLALALGSTSCTLVFGDFQVSGTGGAGGASTGISASSSAGAGTGGAPSGSTASSSSSSTAASTSSSSSSGSSSSADGAACTGGGDCTSGACVDGVCCNVACDTTCQACTQARKGSGVDGVCGNAAAGTTSNGQCSDLGADVCRTNGQCDGNGGCQNYASGTTCEPAMCAGGQATAVRTCAGPGVCQASPQTSCAPYHCDGTACATTCATDSDCSTGRCDVCPSVAKLCIAPLGVGDCTTRSCDSSAAACSPGRTVSMGGRPTGIAFDGTSMWVTMQSANSVVELSPTGTTIGTFTVGNQPNAIAFDGTNMWVANSGDNTVTELSPAGATLGTYPVGNGPTAIAFDGTSMWIVNGQGNTVTKL